MDPNANLKAQRAIIAEIDALMKRTNAANQPPDDDRIADLGRALADLVEALDTWISNGGFLPDTWRRS